MELAELLLKFIEVLIYPMIILIALLLFRKELEKLLSGKLIAKYKDLEITLERIKVEHDYSTGFADKIYGEIDKLEEKQQLAPEVNKIKMLLDGLKLGYWEIGILKYIVVKGQGLRKELTKKQIIEAILGNDDSIKSFDDRRQIEIALENLMRMSLITMDNENYYIVHDLIAAYINEKYH